MSTSSLYMWVHGELPLIVTKHLVMFGKVFCSYATCQAYPISVKDLMLIYQYIKLPFPLVMNQRIFNVYLHQSPMWDCKGMSFDVLLNVVTCIEFVTPAPWQKLKCVYTGIVASFALSVIKYLDLSPKERMRILLKSGSWLWLPSLIFKCKSWPWSRWGKSAHRGSLRWGCGSFSFEIAY